MDEIMTYAYSSDDIYVLNETVNPKDSDDDSLGNIIKIDFYTN